MEREVGGGIGMGNTCKPMAASFQCMTKSTTNKKKERKKNVMNIFFVFFFIFYFWAYWVALVVKNPPDNAGDIRDTGSTPELGRPPGKGNGNPLQYFCLGNPMDGGAW